MLSVSERAVREWVTAGKIKRVGRGAIRLKEAFEFGLQRDVFEGGTSLNELSEEEVQANKSMLEKARADLAETEVGVEKRYLVNRRELGGYMVNEFTLIKRELLALSRTIPSSCYGMNRDEIVDKLQRDLQKVYDERLEASEIGVFIEATEDSK
jgi:hypothetical protein